MGNMFAQNTSRQYLICINYKCLSKYINTTKIPVTKQTKKVST